MAVGLVVDQYFFLLNKAVDALRVDRSKSVSAISQLERYTTLIPIQLSGQSGTHFTHTGWYCQILQHIRLQSALSQTRYQYKGLLDLAQSYSYCLSDPPIAGYQDFSRYNAGQFPSWLSRCTRRRSFHNEWRPRWRFVLFAR